MMDATTHQSRNRRERRWFGERKRDWICNIVVIIRLDSLIEPGQSHHTIFEHKDVIEAHFTCYQICIFGATVGATMQDEFGI